MKLNKDFKVVDYCGYSIIVPEWANYAAVDLDGDFWLYSDYPDSNGYHFYSNAYCRDVNLEYLDQVFEFEDWKESLVKF